ncbi:MAG: TonB family protein [Candidatus Saccharicenans sp.]|jgi:protein TonB|nr:TonB family protein [Candidatus Saccharicenans sp.]
MQPSTIKSSSFKRAVILSLFLHIILFALIGFSNQLTGPKKTGMIHYVNLNFVSLPGGGGGGGRPGPAGEKAGPAEAAPQKETMKELTVPQKVQPQAGSSLRHPVEKTPSTRKPTPPKKTEISAPQPGATTTATKTAETGQAGGSGSGGSGGGGSGLRIGVGEGPGGFGSGYGDPLGTSSFPYTYYLQIIIDKVSSNWFTATSSLDYSGEYQSVIYFKILRNGQVADLKIEQPSDLPALDLTARRAVELAAPFPPLPRDFESEYLVVHLIFERSK